MAPLAARLRNALERELPNVSFDDEIVAHLASFVEGDTLGTDLVENWSPFLISSGACSDEDEAPDVCSKVLARFRNEGPAAAAAAPEPAAAAAGGGAEAAAEEGGISAQLSAWLDHLRLTQYQDSARAWCAKMGAAHINEVIENWEDFAAELKLKKLEMKRVEKDVASRAATPAAPAAPPKPAVAPAEPAGARPAVPASASASPAAPPAVSSPERRAKQDTFGPVDNPTKYLLGEELGTGATATVYRCTCGEETYAVKTISLAKLRLQRDFQRINDKLLREVSILFRLRHPRIVSLYDVVEEPDKLHLVMELVKGGELFDYIVQRGAFSEPVARYVFLQITEGLKYIHSKDIVYRDLKPENILVDETASRQDLLEVKLSDFGHSKLINDGYSTALTRVGTPQYWAPEVSDPVKAARGYDQTVDLWSLGVVLYVMLIGAYPFDGVGERIEDQIRKAHLNFRCQASGRETSTQAQDLIRSLIKVKPTERLSLDSCLKHPWVAIAGGAMGKLMKLCTEAHPGVVEERLQLSVQPSKVQVEAVRRDLAQFMKKFKCSASVQHREVIANLGDEGHLGSERIEAARKELRGIVEYHFGPGSTARTTTAQRVEPALAPVQEVSSREEGGGGLPAKSKSFRLLTAVLTVDKEHGAGLDLQPERGGMRIEKVYDRPGQPGLQKRDLITKINEVSLRGTPDRVEQIFGHHFCDGAQLAIKRES